MSENKTRFVALEVEDVDVARADQYEQGVRGLIQAMRQAKLGREFEWHASQYNLSYFYSFPLSSLADLDPETGVTQQRFKQLLAAVDPDVAKEFSQATVQSVQATRLFVLERVAEFTYEASNSVVKSPKHAILDIHHVRTGQLEPYKAAIHRLMAAVRRANYPIGWAAYRVLIGEGKTFYGEGKVYYYVVAFDSPTQFYEQHSFAGALAKALGEDGARQLLLDERRCLVSLEASEHRLRPDLGYTSE